jgi:hypothetical protein
MSRPKPSSRINGRLSRGPKTQVGKDRSKLNALRHGLVAREPVLPDESPEDFERLVEAYQQSLHPQTDAQSQLVADMSFAKWRMRRLTAYEAFEISRRIEAQPPGDPDRRTAAGFEEFLEDGTCARLLRYDGHFQRVFNRSFKAFNNAANNAKTTERT